MQVLIIGGTGLISTAITRCLVARGDVYTKPARRYPVREDEEPMTWNQYHQTVAQAMNAPEPELVHMPTDLLFEIAPRAAEWCRENFQYNNIFDNTAAKTDLNFRWTIPFVEGVRRIVAWLDARDSIHDKDEPPAYEEIIASWKRLSTKETFFGESGSAKT